LVSVASAWFVIALRRDPLVLEVAERGILLGPTLGQLLRFAEDRVDDRLLDWDGIRLAVVDVREAKVTDSGICLRRVRIRLTPRNGKWIERALPPGVDVEALNVALRANAPVATSVALHVS
jgi:hypothetical protein